MQGPSSWQDVYNKLHTTALRVNYHLLNFTASKTARYESMTTAVIGMYETACTSDQSPPLPAGTCTEADALMGGSTWTRKVRHREQAQAGRSAGR